MRGTWNGTPIGYAGLGVFGGCAVLGMTGTLDDAVLWALGPALVERIVTWAAVLATLAAVVWLNHRARMSHMIRVDFHPDPHDPEIGIAARHEGQGHAAVGYGVRGYNGSGISAVIREDGSGSCYVPDHGLTLAQRMAITYGGEVAAGPSGCSSDRARFNREARRAPSRYRSRVKADARALAHRHHGNAFGRRVERSLLRSGRFH